jgi:hypothetical protein
VEAPVWVLQVWGIVSKIPAFFEGIGEEAQENCFDCFPDFWDVFCRFIEEWMVGTIGNNPEADLWFLTY